MLAFGLGALLVRGLGPDPVIEREAAALVCASGQPRVCVWPEHRGRLEEVAALAAQADAAWRQLGLAVPSEFSERRPAALPPGAGAFRISRESRPGDIVVSLAYGLLPPPPRCALVGTAPYPGGAAARYVTAWLADAAGLPRAELGERFGPDVLATVAAVRAMPSARQQAWLERNVAALRACEVEPWLEPGI